MGRDTFYIWNPYIFGNPLCTLSDRYFMVGCYYAFGWLKLNWRVVGFGGGVVPKLAFVSYSSLILDDEERTNIRAFHKV